MENSKSKYLTLFLSTLQLSAFTFGGIGSGAWMPGKAGLIPYNIRRTSGAGCYSRIPAGFPAAGRVSQFHYTGPRRAVSIKKNACFLRLFPV